MAFDVNAFRAKLLQGGARPSLFEVILTPPSYVGLNVEQFSFMCEAASLPESVVGVVEVPYMGRTIKLGGDRSFSNWDVMVINDETFDLRNAFERWNSGIASHSSENEAVRALGATSSPSSYVGKALVQQYSKEGKIIKTYEMINVWPPMVGRIDLAWSSANQIERFPVQFCMDLWKTKDSTA